MNVDDFNQYDVHIELQRAHQEIARLNEENRRLNDENEDLFQRHGRLNEYTDDLERKYDDLQHENQQQEERLEQIQQPVQLRIRPYQLANEDLKSDIRALREARDNNLADHLLVKSQRDLLLNFAQASCPRDVYLGLKNKLDEMKSDDWKNRKREDYGRRLAYEAEDEERDEMHRRSFASYADAAASVEASNEEEDIINEEDTCTINEEH